MNKKEYQKPTMNVVKIQQTQMLCSSVTGTSNNAGINEDILPGSGPARARSFGGFDDWDED